ncbi:maleylpyruvate isomerase family mycothiol-dependent enzyme [Streptomyces sp. PmtG]
METAEHIEVLDQEGRLLALAAEEAGTGAAVPTCPGWRVRDLLRHTGEVHRWAAAFVADAHPSYRASATAPELEGAELLAWFRAGHADLVATLAAAPPDLSCWTFLPAPSPRAFWARRQANETAIHRVDAESARGGTPTAVGTEFAVDGIDELLLGFHARERSQVRSPEPRVLRVRATDADAAWTVHLSTGAPVIEHGDTVPADCEVAGQAAYLYPALWNRLPFPQITGDAALATLWRETSAVG